MITNVCVMNICTLACSYSKIEIHHTQTVLYKPHEFMLLHT